MAGKNTGHYFLCNDGLNSLFYTGILLEEIEILF